MTDDRKRWTRTEVDRAVTQWRKSLAVATQNILELMDDFFYKWLAGDGPSPPAAVEGMTEREVVPALRALDELWQMLPALNRVLEQVYERHESLPTFHASDELFEIQNLLEGESVQIATKTSYAQRGLLTPEEVTRAVTPERLLHAMVEAYARAKAVVVKVGEAAKRANSQLDQVARELIELRAVESSLGEPLAELEGFEAKVTALKGTIVRDPLSVAEDIDENVLPALELLRRHLDDVRVEHAQLDSDVAAAGTLIVSLEQAFSKAMSVYEERVLKVTPEDVESVPTPLEPSVIADLKAWLERLELTLQHGSWQAVKIGLANWKVQVDARRAECDKVIVENARPLERRRELRGLLDGLKAKAVDTGLGEDEALATLYRRAYDLLYSRPTPLGVAERLVSEYLAALR